MEYMTTFDEDEIFKIKTNKGYDLLISFRYRFNDDDEKEWVCMTYNPRKQMWNIFATEFACSISKEKFKDKCENLLKID